MSMHIEGPWLTNLSTKKRKQKITKAQQEEFERGWRERNQRLKQMSLPKETFEQYMDWLHGRGKKEKTTKTFGPTSSIPGTKPTTRIVKNKPEARPEASKEREFEAGGKISSTIGPRWTPSTSCAKKQAPTYTGEKLIGIGVMHKSNLVPIFSDSEAKDLSKMRR